MIVATLEHYDGHRAKTAAALGIGVRTLSGKLRSYGVAPGAKGLDESTKSSRQELPLSAAKATASDTVMVERGDEKVA